jgi:uncharacterized phage protein (TIGR01671 family)
VELLFRVWDKDKKRMSKILTIYSPIVQWSDGDIDMPTDFGLSKSDRFVFMQYTATKDKYDKKIFDGDIIKFFDNDEAVITWSSHGFYAMTDDCDLQLFYGLKDIEVVGNIYENPNLLK